MVDVPVGSLLVLYSDGMVEDRRTGLDPGLPDFISAVGRLAARHARDPQALASAVMREMAGPERDDDMTLLIARHVGAPRPSTVEQPARPRAGHGGARGRRLTRAGPAAVEPAQGGQAAATGVHLMPRRGSRPRAPDSVARALGPQHRFTRRGRVASLSEGATMRRRTAVAAVLAVGVTVGPGLDRLRQQPELGRWQAHADVVHQPRRRRVRPHQEGAGPDRQGVHRRGRRQVRHPGAAAAQQRQRPAPAAPAPARGQDSGIDLMSIDPVFVAEFAEAKFLAPVPQDMVAGFTKDTVNAAIEASTWKGRPGRGAVLGQHPAALVPQERGQGGRAGHDQAGDLGAADQGRAVAEEDDRRPGQPLRGLRRLDQRPHRRRRRQDPRSTPAPPPTGSSSAWRRPPARPPPR